MGETNALLMNEKYMHNSLAHYQNLELYHIIILYIFKKPLYILQTSIYLDANKNLKLYQNIWRLDNFVVYLLLNFSFFEKKKTDTLVAHHISPIFNTYYKIDVKPSY